MKIVLTLMLFILILAGGLVAVNINLNNITGSAQKVSIVAVDKLSYKVYKVNIMGSERDINIGVYEAAVKKTVRLIFTGITDIRESIAGFLNQAKRCSTF